ncbi:class F sortase [Streptomyces sp. NPDC050560]|uniref:class F sortase n=1 Tax=Streptomyces sp. NPDC050560 TaxID=3365630 RepID=UPI0037A97B19
MQKPAPPADAGGRQARHAEPTPTASGAPSSSGSTGDGGGTARTAAPALPASRPQRVSIPALHVSAPLEALDTDGHDAMTTPRTPSDAGWYRPGPTPGETGPAVIAGHVTWNGAPAVFFDLAKLVRGDTVSVQRRDGRTARFTVDRVATYEKQTFPTVEVYRNLDYPGLRLITCGGRYSAADHRYASNVVVYATLSDEP